MLRSGARRAVGASPQLGRLLTTDASSDVFDVAIVGAGVVGAALACALK
jgi:hypothetical protein